jgi:thymidylate synthase (FAD)
MQVKLTNITPDAEKTISYIARVSNPANQENPNYVGLIKYLIKHKHWSPFEMAHMTVEIKTSRAIAAQILRHRSFSFQEYSQRYSEVTEFEPIELRKQSTKNRQSSLEVFDPDIKSGTTSTDKASNVIMQHLIESRRRYEFLLEAGVAKEVARMILPLTTQTTLFMVGNIRSWIHYIELRTKEDTQKEHRDIALAIKAIFDTELPTISKALAVIKKEQQDKEYLWQLLEFNETINVAKVKQDRNI